MKSGKTMLGVAVVMFLVLAVNPAWAREMQGKPLPEKMSLDLGGGVKMDFVLIRPGSFMMGSEKGEEYEKPVHEVKITKPFYMGAYEVTQAQWKAVMGDTPSKFKGDDLPVEQVNWEDCQRFLQKLKAKVGSGLTCRLPTEAEWEYACRAGSKTEYSFGDDADLLAEYAAYDNNREGKTHPVGRKKPNAWGLYDMHGNVWEWCADWYGSDYYAKSPKENPPGPSEAEANVMDLFGVWKGKCRVLRGGSSYYNPRDMRSANRYGSAPSFRNDIFGFRAVLAAQE